MALNFSLSRLLANEEEPLLTDDVLTAAYIIRDQLQKLEARCLGAQEKGEHLKKKRDELTDILRLFKMVEENERDATHDLKRELETAQRDLSQGTILDVDSSLATSFFGAIRNSVSPTIRHAAHDISASASVVNNPKSAISATLKQIASLIRDPQDASYVSLNSMDGDDFEAVLSDNGTTDAAKPSKDTSRVLGAVTALKTNVAHSLRNGVTKTKKDATQPKYVGGIALKKTMPHKVRRQSRKPFVPLVFSKSRVSMKRKGLPTPAQDLEIGLPFNARKVAGTSSHLGDPTMEALKGDEAFGIGISDLSSAFPVLTPVNSLEA